MGDSGEIRRLLDAVGSASKGVSWFAHVGLTHTEPVDSCAVLA